MANDLPFTVKDKAAPVVDVDHTVPPWATLIGACFHGAATLMAFADDVTTPLATKIATTASARFDECICPPYLPHFLLHRHLDDSLHL
ncbi:MAG: hypothetical protein EXQ61_06425 [Ilumatobacteraceae bacterium]|nr:hypothetical protein [Ilumatobacteraceae bacterium]